MKVTRTREGANWSPEFLKNGTREENFQQLLGRKTFIVEFIENSDRHTLFEEEAGCRCSVINTKVIDRIGLLCVKYKFIANDLIMDLKWERKRLMYG